MVNRNGAVRPISLLPHGRKFDTLLPFLMNLRSVAMQFDFAPMEGITGSLYLRTHARHFPGIRRYFIPFLEPRDGKCFDGHDQR